MNLKTTDSTSLQQVLGFRPGTGMVSYFITVLTLQVGKLEVREVKGVPAQVVEQITARTWI